MNAAFFKYIAKKVLLLLPLLWGVVTLIFVLLELSPGTAVDKFITEDTSPEVRAMLVAKWHLDQPAYLRYFGMLRNLAVADFGVSMQRDKPVFGIIAEFLPNTVLLSFVTMMVQYPLGISLGTAQAWLQGRRNVDVLDTGISLGSLTLYSMPGFVLALLMQYTFAYALKGTMFELPSSAMFDPVMYEYMGATEQWIDRAKHLILPGVFMGVAHSAGIARYMRSAVLEVIRQDYIRTARAKGLSEWRVVLVHGLRNALLPVITLFGLSLPGVFAGSVLVERIFAWPGMGRCIVDAIFAQDTPLIIACFFVYACIVAAGSLLADLSYALADPRIRYDA